MWQNKRLLTMLVPKIFLEMLPASEKQFGISVLKAFTDIPQDSLAFKNNTKMVFK